MFCGSTDLRDVRESCRACRANCNLNIDADRFERMHVHIMAGKPDICDSQCARHDSQDELRAEQRDHTPDDNLLAKSVDLRKQVCAAAGLGFRVTNPAGDNLKFR